MGQVSFYQEALNIFFEGVILSYIKILDPWGFVLIVRFFSAGCRTRAKCRNPGISVRLSHLPIAESIDPTKDRSGPTGLKIQVNVLVDKNGREHEIGSYFHVNRRELLVRK